MTTKKKEIFELIREKNFTEFSTFIDYLIDSELDFSLEEILDTPYIYIEYLNSRRRTNGIDAHDYKGDVYCD